jgi:hypothetical protein
MTRWHHQFCVLWMPGGVARESAESPRDIEKTRVLFRFMMDIVAPVGVFQVWDAVPVAGRRWFRLLCDTIGFMLPLRDLGGVVVLVELGVVEQRFQAVLEVLGGAAVTDVARRYGVARQTVHRWF